MIFLNETSLFSSKIKDIPWLRVNVNVCRNREGVVGDVSTCVDADGGFKLFFIFILIIFYNSKSIPAAVLRDGGRSVVFQNRNTLCFFVLKGQRKSEVQR